MRQHQSVILIFCVFVGLMAALVLQSQFPQPAGFETTITLDFPKTSLAHNFSYRDFYLEQAALSNHALALKSDPMINALMTNETIQKIFSLEDNLIKPAQKTEAKKRLFNAITAVAASDAKQIVVTVTDLNAVLAREIATLIPVLYNDLLFKQMTEHLITQKIKGEIISLLREEDEIPVDAAKMSEAAGTVLDQIADIDASLNALNPELPQTLGDPKLTALFARYVQLKLDLARQDIDPTTQQNLLTEMGKIKTDFHLLLSELRVSLTDKLKTFSESTEFSPTPLAQNSALTEIVALDPNDQKQLTEKPFVVATPVQFKRYLTNNTLLLIGVGALSGLVLGMTALALAEQIARYRIYRKRLRELLKHGANDNKRKAA